jgi:dipeptidyl-peptidase-4
MTKIRRAAVGVIAGVTIVAAFAAGVAEAQNRFEQLPGFDRFREAQGWMGRAGADGRAGGVTWIDATQLRYRNAAGWHVLDLSTGTVTDLTDEEAEAAQQDGNANRGGNRRNGERVARGRQATIAESPDEKWIAQHRDWNLVIVNNESKAEFNVTNDGTATHKYATGSWVYGEELNQNTAMWWSPDSKRVAFYEFDEANVVRFPLMTNLTEVQSTLETEGYPKAGAANPIVGLRVYDLESGTTTAIDLGTDANQYVYNVRWTPDGSELLFNRTNRHQSVLDVMAANPANGATRIILTETQETWQDNSPAMRFLADGRRFIWETERTGWRHYELRTLDGSLLNPLTSGAFPCAGIVQLDEDAGWLYVTATSAANPLDVQLHRVRLDGREWTRLTPGDGHYTSFSIAPDHCHFVATSEAMNRAPVTRVFDVSGRAIATLAEADVSGLPAHTPPELFTFKADDGVTDLYGVLCFPTDFDPAKNYPLLVDVYGGPQSRAVQNRFTVGDPWCEFGFLTVRIDNRGTTGRGKTFESAGYLRLGSVDLKDQADGVRFLAQRPYVDASRVGIHGHSYGGYMAALAVLKHPDVFHVAVAGAPVTDWRHYDTIYTERYMRTPQENPEGYDAGSCITFAKQLVGKLLILHGAVDDNVHPNNTWQLIDEFHKERLPFQLMMYPRSGHGIGGPSVMPLKWEFLWDHLIGAPGASAGG